MDLKSKCGIIEGMAYIFIIYMGRVNVFFFFIFLEKILGLNKIQIKTIKSKKIKQIKQIFTNKNQGKHSRHKKTRKTQNNTFMLICIFFPNNNSRHEQKKQKKKKMLTTRPVHPTSSLCMYTANIL